MAIVIDQLSKCPVCNNVLDKSKEYILIPPLISNILDPLFLFNDSGVHVECINKSENKDKLLYHIKMYHDNGIPSKLKCSIDGKEIIGPGNLIFFGLLTSDESEDLYKYNYLAFNIKNIRKWNEYFNFLEIAKKFLSEGKWMGLTEFNKLKYIINQV